MFNKPFFIYFLKVQVIKRIILFLKDHFFIWLAKEECFLGQLLLHQKSQSWFSLPLDNGGVLLVSNTALSKEQCFLGKLLLQQEGKSWFSLPLDNGGNLLISNTALSKEQCFLSQLQLK